VPGSKGKKSFHSAEGEREAAAKRHKRRGSASLRACLQQQENDFFRVLRHYAINSRLLPL